MTVLGLFTTPSKMICFEISKQVSAMSHLALLPFPSPLFLSEGFRQTSQENLHQYPQ